MRPVPIQPRACFFVVSIKVCHSPLAQRPPGFVEQLGPKRILHRNICYVNNDEDEETVVAALLYRDQTERWERIVFLPQDSAAGLSAVWWLLSSVGAGARVSVIG